MSKMAEISARKEENMLIGTCKSEFKNRNNQCLEDCLKCNYFKIGEN